MIDVVLNLSYDLRERLRIAAATHHMNMIDLIEFWLDEYCDTILFTIDDWQNKFVTKRDLSVPRADYQPPTGKNALIAFFHEPSLKALRKASDKQQMTKSEYIEFLIEAFTQPLFVGPHPMKRFYVKRA